MATNSNIIPEFQGVPLSNSVQEDLLWITSRDATDTVGGILLLGFMASVVILLTMVKK